MKRININPIELAEQLAKEEGKPESYMSIALRAQDRIAELEAQVFARDARLEEVTHQRAGLGAALDNAEARVKELEVQKKDAAELFSAVEQEIKGLVAQAIGAFEQNCTAREAVRWLVRRYEATLAALGQYANDKKQAREGKKWPRI